MNHCIFIMAGGLGKRMKSDLPKVLHKIAEIPMLVRVIQESIKTNPYKIFVVVGKYKYRIYCTKSSIRNWTYLNVCCRSTKIMS